MSRSLLITGATGKQGGAAIRALLSRNADFRLLAVTRDKTSRSAQKLASLSPKVTLLQGDLNDTDAIFRHARDLSNSSPWGVFSVQVPKMGARGAEVEQAQGISLVDSALKDGVKHFVYSSVDRHGDKSINNPTNIPHFLSKHNIEHHLINSTKSKDAMSWTILRPVAFMENLDGGFVGKLFATAIKARLSQKPLQLIATEDIGKVAAEAFLRPEEYKGKAISLAGDEVNYHQLAEIFREKTGAEVPVTWNILARLLLASSKEMGTMFSFFEKEGYAADIEALRRQYPELKDVRTWLETSPYMK
ncbi:nmrA-like family domain-containing protein [Trichoderma breve]|uniref:NmrA-like family domain-containing protein n=1 Tax=Trichoderma breve TaxID=2034170 RepID=A0A9W9E9K2_9HYPO|nr:nmrA-like family domain-containing protein [Trichoderma breve]KAJ4861892.1 nmrA-like family domain-containing protein [Trichoderma breve]